jgi:RND family efflux transporter MFP subunit
MTEPQSDRHPVAASPPPPSQPGSRVPDPAPPATSSPVRRFLMITAAILLVGAVLTAIVVRRGAPAAGTAVAPAAAPITVAVVPVERGAVTSSQVYDGEFISFQQTDVHPEVAGFLTAILVDEGDHVKEHQLLATLEIPGLDEEIARAQAQREHDKGLAAKTKATYEVDHQTFQRLQGVAAQQANLIAQQDIDEAKSHDLASSGAWQAAVSQEAVSRAELDKLLTYQRYCRITAPFTGAVTRRFVDPGALVQGGVAAGASITPLVTLSQIDVLRLSFPVTESVVPRVHVGQAISYRINALHEDKQGVISRFTQRVDNATRTMEVQIDVANPDGRITPGMYASVTMEVERHDHVLTLPHEAVRRRAQEVLVYAVGADHRIEERQIAVGLEGPSRLEIISGVTDGEQVVFGNLEKVKPGQLVEPKPMKAQGGPAAP